MMMHNKAFSLVMFFACVFLAVDAAAANDLDSFVFAYFMIGLAAYFVWEGSAGPTKISPLLPKTDSYYTASEEELRRALRNICEISETESEIRNRIADLGCPHEPFINFIDGGRVLAMFPTSKEMIIASASKGHHAVPMMFEEQWLAKQREYRQLVSPVVLYQPKY